MYQIVSLLQTSPSLCDRKSGTGSTKCLQSSPSMRWLALTTPYFLPERRELCYKQVGVSCQCFWGLDSEHWAGRGLCRLTEQVSLNLPVASSSTCVSAWRQGNGSSKSLFLLLSFFYSPLVPTQMLTLKRGEFYSWVCGKPG